MSLETSFLSSVLQTVLDARAQAMGGPESQPKLPPLYQQNSDSSLILPQSIACLESMYPLSALSDQLNNHREIDVLFINLVFQEGTITVNKDRRQGQETRTENTTKNSKSRNLGSNQCHEQWSPLSPCRTLPQRQYQLEQLI